MRGEFLEVGTERLYYYAAGSRGAGGPVLLLHGFPLSSHLWGALVPLLPAGRRYVVLDQLGSGRSVPGAAADLTIAGHSQRLAGFLDGLGVDSATVVAHGTACAVAASLVHLIPSRVEALVLVSPDEAGIAHGGMLRGTAALAPSVARWVLRRRLRRAFLGTSTAAHSADLYLRPYTTAEGWRVFVEQERAAPGWTIPDMGDSVPRLSIVHGGEDERGRVAAVAFARRYPSATLHAIAASGAMVPEEAPEQLAGLLGSLLTR